VRIVAGGLVEVAVAGVDIEVGELGDLREGVGAALGHQADDASTDRGEVSEPARALERFKFATVIGVLLEEIPTAGYGAHAA